MVSFKPFQINICYCFFCIWEEIVFLSDIMKYEASESFWDLVNQLKISQTISKVTQCFWSFSSDSPFQKLPASAHLYRQILDVVPWSESGRA